VPQAELVDALFEEIDRSLDRGGVEIDEAKAGEGAAWLAKIEEENADDLTPEKIAQLEHEAAEKGESDRVLLDEDASPTAGRRFTRA
jgi:(E)-4-hydroxy-3-methylbut-2-enyl-diphosphate synthase